MKCARCKEADRYSTGPYCRPCSKAYYKERLAERRAYIHAVKTAVGCEMCGYNAHPAALEFDHIDPTTKKHSIGRELISLSMKKLKEEIAKCRVLCANCHQIHTYEQVQSKSLQEG